LILSSKGTRTKAVTPCESSCVLKLVNDFSQVMQEKGSYPAGILM